MHFKPIPVYALTAVTKFEIKDQYKGRKGRFIKNFLLNDTRNKNGWRTTWESIKTYYEDFLNKPGTYFERELDSPDHPDGETYKKMMSNQENYRVVNIAGLELDETTHSLYSISEILDEELTEINFEELLDSGKINFTSPGIWPVKAEIVGTMPDGRPELDVSEWKALHFSYINDPAFGEIAAKTLGTCEGLGVDCMTRLAANTETEISQKMIDIGTKIEMEHTDDKEVSKKIALDHLKEDPDYYVKLITYVEPDKIDLLGGNESLAPLQEVPLIRNKLNQIYTPCELKAFHKELTAQDADPSCVSKKLKIVMRDNPEMDKDQQLAIAYAYCREEGLAELADDLKNKRDIEIIGMN